MQAAWACVLAASGTYDQLTDYVIFASWIFYGLVTSAVFVLRIRAPDLPRPYRTLGYPVVPLVFVLVAIWLVINTLINRPVESVAGLVLIALGLPVYWYFRRVKESGHSPTDVHRTVKRGSGNDARVIQCPPGRSAPLMASQPAAASRE